MSCTAVTEPEFLDAVKRVGDHLARTFAFGQYTAEDIWQEVAVFCLEALPRFRPELGLPLSSFLFRHARNRILNLKRAKYSRTDPPCRVCFEHEHEGGRGHPDGSVCSRYQEWSERQKRRRSECYPSDLNPECESASDSSPVEVEAEGRELEALIRSRLPPELRADFELLREGGRLLPSKTRRVREAVLDILADVDAIEDECWIFRLPEKSAKPGTT